MTARKTLLLSSALCIALFSVVYSLGFETKSSREVEVKSQKRGAARDQQKIFSIDEQVKRWESSIPESLQKTYSKFYHSKETWDIKMAARLADSLGLFGLSGYHLLQLVEKQPTDTALWVIAASRLLNAGVQEQDEIAAWCITEAGKAAKEILQLDPENPYGKNIQAEVILRSGDDSRVMEAVTLLKDVLKKDPDNVMSLENLGSLQLRSGQWDKAEVTYQKLNQLDPVNPEYLVHLSDCKLSLGNKVAAKNLLTNALPLVKDQAIRDEINKKIKDIH